MNKSLTIVLPVYNAESRLRRDVTELLELASDLTPTFGLLIVDDGSTDATFEVAAELAAHFPQVVVRRHRHRCGLGATIDYVQRRVRSDAVMLHDGVTPVNPQQMRSVWQRWIERISSPAAAASSARIEGDMSDFARQPAVHKHLEQAHRRLLGFQLVTNRSTADAAIDAVAPPTAATQRCDSAQLSRSTGVGRIPPCPRPKFISALAAFALGE